MMHKIIPQILKEKEKFREFLKIQGGPDGKALF